MKSILAGFVALALIVSAKAEAQVKPSEDLSRISLAIEVTKTEVAVGERVLVTITTTNISPYPYCEKQILENELGEFNDYVVHATNLDGSLYPNLKKPLPRVGFSSGLLCLPPGKKSTDQLLANTLIDMSQPGVYLVTVEHRDRGTNVTAQSNVVKVTVH